jgi:hypothetical protein
MRRWVDLLAPRIPAIEDPELTEMVARIVSVNASHAVLFRQRALAHGVDPDRYVCPPEGELIYARMSALTLDETLAYALGSLEHFADLLAVYGEAAADDDDATVLAEVRKDNDAAVVALRDVVRAHTAPAADAHELYRLRELAETPLYARRR